jgi:CheY-like chemotaxis protein
MTPAHVRRAIALYLESAWPEGVSEPARASRSAIEAAPTLEQVFALLQRDKGDDPDGFRRYTLRLGNARYPFMKFVIQEHLVDQEFFFSVDTHDNLDVRPDAPDYDAWQRLKEYNRELKDAIENAWRADHLPTNEDLRRMCERLAPGENRLAAGEPGEKLAHAPPRLLVVDDDRSVAIGLGALLRARGYEVELCFNGEDALLRLWRRPLPDLVILDYELPSLDGEAVLERIRREPELAQLPVLMATAASIDLSRVGRASGLLRKPYDRNVLYAMIEQLLRPVPARGGS